MQDQGLERDDGAKYLRTGTVVFVVYGIHYYTKDGATVEGKTLLKCFQKGSDAAIYVNNCYSKRDKTYSAAGNVYDKIDMKQMTVE